MTQQQADELPVGIYHIRWACGGSSVGAIGKTQRGQSWYAPANWVAVPSSDWSLVASVVLIKRGFQESDG